MVGFRIFPEKELIIEYLEGLINITEMIEFTENLKSADLYSNKYNILADIRELNFKPDLKSTIKYVDYLKHIDEIAGTKKLAVLTNSPQTVVLATIFMEFSKELPIIINIFSTFEAAVEWLDIFGFSYDDYTRIISEIRDHD